MDNLIEQQIFPISKAVIGIWYWTSHGRKIYFDRQEHGKYVVKLEDGITELYLENPNFEVVLMKNDFIKIISSYESKLREKDKQIKALTPQTEINDASMSKIAIKLSIPTIIPSFQPMTVAWLREGKSDEYILMKLKSLGSAHPKTVLVFAKKRISKEVEKCQ